MRKVIACLLLAVAVTGGQARAYHATPCTVVSDPAGDTLAAAAQPAPWADVRTVRMAVDGGWWQSTEQTLEIVVSTRAAAPNASDPATIELRWELSYYRTFVLRTDGHDAYLYGPNGTKTPVEAFTMRNHTVFRIPLSVLRLWWFDGMMWNIRVATLAAQADPVGLLDQAPDDWRADALGRFAVSTGCAVAPGARPGSAMCARMTDARWDPRAYADPDGADLTDVVVSRSRTALTADLYFGSNPKGGWGMGDLTYGFSWTAAGASYVAVATPGADRWSYRLHQPGDVAPAQRLQSPGAAIRGSVSSDWQRVRFEVPLSMLTAAAAGAKTLADVSGWVEDLARTVDSTRPAARVALAPCARLTTGS